MAQAGSSPGSTSVVRTERNRNTPRKQPAAEFRSQCSSGPRTSGWASVPPPLIYLRIDRKLRALCVFCRVPERGQELQTCDDGQSTLDGIDHGRHPAVSGVTLRIRQPSQGSYFQPSVGASHIPRLHIRSSQASTPASSQIWACRSKPLPHANASHGSCSPTTKIISGGQRNDVIPARQISKAAENCPLSRSIRCLSAFLVARRQGLSGRLTISARWKLPLSAFLQWITAHLHRPCFLWPHGSLREGSNPGNVSVALRVCDRREKSCTGGP